MIAVQESTVWCFSKYKTLIFFTHTYVCLHYVCSTLFRRIEGGRWNNLLLILIYQLTYTEDITNVEKQTSPHNCTGWAYLGMHIHLPEGTVNVYMYWLILIHMNVCSYSCIWTGIYRRALVHTGIKTYVFS